MFSCSSDLDWYRLKGKNYRLFNIYVNTVGFFGRFVVSFSTIGYTFRWLFWIFQTSKWWKVKNCYSDTLFFLWLSLADFSSFLVYSRSNIFTDFRFAKLWFYVWNIKILSTFTVFFGRQTNDILFDIDAKMVSRCGIFLAFLRRLFRGVGGWFII